MIGRGQGIFEMVGSIINLPFITVKRNTSFFLQDPVNFVCSSLFLHSLHFWGLDVPKILIFSGNCYLRLNQCKSEILLVNTN